MQLFRNGYDIVTVGINLTEIKTTEDLKKINMSKPTVFTYGSFQKLDAQQIDFLYEAHCFGARLIVGLINDNWASFTERLAILLANKYVDYVVELNSDDSLPDVLKALSVDILVFGSDQVCPAGLEAHVGEVKKIELLKDVNSLVQKLRHINANYGLPKKGK